MTCFDWSNGQPTWQTGFPADKIRGVGVKSVGQVGGWFRSTSLGCNHLQAQTKKLAGQVGDGSDQQHWAAAIFKHRQRENMIVS